MKEIEEIFDEIEIEPSKIVGWGSMENSTMITLTIAAYPLKPHCNREVLTFKVTKNLHTTINGKTTHNIEISSKELSCYDLTEQDGVMFLPETTGSLKNFEFGLTLKSIKAFTRVNQKSNIRIRLVAYCVNENIKIYWRESDRKIDESFWD